MFASLLLTVLLGGAAPSGHVVAGTVRDSAGRPVGGVLVSLRTTLPAGGAQVRSVMTRTDGTFRLANVPAGPQALRAMADGYVRPDPISFVVGDGDPAREHAVVLDRGALRTVRVFDAQGQPAAKALVIGASDSFVRATATTDAKGRALLPSPKGNLVIYALPSEASFGLRRVPPTEHDVRIDVPAAASTLEVATLTTGGEALPHVGLLVRYNGELLPPEVARALGRRKMMFRTGEDGRTRLSPLPRGTYELWPYRSEDEAEALMSSASGAAAPATVNVLTGENKVTIRFRRR